jgi:hypothetical protein
MRAATPAFSWDAATDAGIGVGGYSYEIDHAADTVPDTTPDTGGTSASFSGKADGVWYFHVRAVDVLRFAGATSTRIVRIDTSAPAISGLASSTHPVENTWYASSDPAFSWDAATDSSSGLAGYSYVLDQSSGTTPDTTPDTTGTTASFTGKADGVWYFHVRAVDNLGNGGATSTRIVRIDTTAPSAINNLASSTHFPEATWNACDHPDFSWDVASDAGSGVAGYSYELDHSSGTVPDTTIETTGTTASFTGKADGEWYFHVRAVDAAGHGGPTSSYVLGIDRHPPSAITGLASSTHPVEATWYASSDPAFSWDAATDAGIGVGGYSFVLDQASDTVPNTTIDTTGTTASFTGKGDGVWYFHVRAIDSLGNAGATATRTVRIDTSAPAITGLTSSTHPVEATWYSSSDPAFSWDAATDSHSGLAGYSYEIDHAADTVPDATADTTDTTASYTGKADGVWYFHVRAVDNLGNAGATSTRIVRIDKGTIVCATPDGQAWSTDGIVYAVAVAPDGTTYIGGDFEHVGFATGSGAALDATVGTADMSFPVVEGGGVFATAPDGAGGYYIGGYFTKVGGLTRKYIAHVLADGSVDPSFNPSANNYVRDLAVSGSTVYAGGDFSSIGGQTRNYIAALDATTGSVLPWNPNANDTVAALAVSGSTVYAGGEFHSIGGQTRNHIAALDPATGAATSWNPDAGGAGYPYVSALVVSGTTVYAGGSFSSIGGQSRNNIAALDSTVATGNATAWDPNANSAVNALAVSGSTVYAGGGFRTIGGASRNYIAALDATVNTNNATAWNPNASGTVSSWNPDASGDVNALAVSGSIVYAGGFFTTIGGATRNYVAALDSATGTATAWNPNANGPVGALTVSDSTIYAGGTFSAMGQQFRPHVAQLDASGNVTSWYATPNNTVRALAVSGSTVYAGGDFTMVSGQAHTRIAAIDAGTGLATAWDPNADARVWALAVSGSTVYAGGDFTSIGGQSRNRIAALDATVNTNNATAWNPNAQSTVAALAVSGSTVYVGGGFNAIGGQSRGGIAALDATTGTATSWNPNANSAVWALAVSGSTIYAGGAFTTIGGQTRNHIAAIPTGSNTPTSWDPNANSTVNALAVKGSKVYAGGYFTSMGGQTRNRIAALDASGAATAWDPNADARVWALAVSGSSVYAGGEFTTVGGQARPYLARFSTLPAGSMSLNGDATYGGSVVTIDSAISGATEMRFRNEGGSWSSWEAYSASKEWTLSPGDGSKTVHAQYRTPPGNALALSDSVILDTTDPETSDDAPSGWQDVAVTVTLTADDGSGSGVASTKYKLDGAPEWTTYADPLEITAEGDHTLVYRSTDNAGNVEDAHTCHVRIDATPPVTADNAGSGVWHAGPFTLHLTPSDEGSGMSGGQAKTEHSTDDGATWQTGLTKTYEVWKRGGGSGTYTVLVRSTDAAGNLETPKTVTVHIDSIVPYTSDDAPSGAHNHDVTVHFSAGDSMSGVGETWYRLDDASWTRGSQVTITAAGNDGTHWIHYYSIDNCGNQETREHRCSVTIDTSGGGSLAPAVTPLPAPTASAPQRALRPVKRHPPLRHQRR